MKYCFLYAGQGSQKAGMGKDFYEEYETYRRVIDSADLSFDPKALMHDGSEEELARTEYTQPCMSLFAAGVTEVLKENGIEPEAALGLSLGEYGALYAAGVFRLEDYIRTVAYRGKVMAEAAEGKTCAMSAIIGMQPEIVKEACEHNQKHGYVTVANYNCPGQYVICGDEAAVTAVEEELRSKGGKRFVRLKVSGPFHTAYMKEAGSLLRAYFDEVSFFTPKIPVVLNYTGEFVSEGADLKALLECQIQNSVRLEDSLKKILAEDVDLYVEIGPGNTMAGFLRKCAKAVGKTVQVKSIECVQDLKDLLMEVQAEQLQEKERRK